MPAAKRERNEFGADAFRDAPRKCRHVGGAWAATVMREDEECRVEIRIGVDQFVQTYTIDIAHEKGPSTVTAADANDC